MPHNVSFHERATRDERQNRKLHPVSKTNACRTHVFFQSHFPIPFYIQHDDDTSIRFALVNESSRTHWTHFDMFLIFLFSLDDGNKSLVSFIVTHHHSHRMCSFLWYRNRKEMIQWTTELGGSALMDVKSILSSSSSSNSPTVQMLSPRTIYSPRGTFSTPCDLE